MKALRWLLTIAAVLAFAATTVLAYIGALTDGIHAWQTCFVSMFLTLILGGAATMAWADFLL